MDRLKSLGKRRCRRVGVVGVLIAELRSVTDGPFAESQQVVAGFWIWQVPSMEEAFEWAKWCSGATEDHQQFTPVAGEAGAQTESAPSGLGISAPYLPESHLQNIPPR
jgi:hypothetical protein